MTDGLSLSYILMIIIVLLISISIHEMMHAFTAHRLGDPTAEEEGRITLNPLAHIDPLLTVALPAIMIIMGLPPVLAAKPVPFRPDLVRGGDWGSALVAIMGPVSNLVLAVLGALLLHTLSPATALFDFLMLFVTINVGLFVFNMLPIPPLDGSRVLYAVAPEPVRRVMEMIESFGVFVILIIVVVGYQYIAPFISNITTSILQILL